MNEKRVGYVVHMESTSRQPLTDSMGRLKALHAKWNFAQIYADEAGLGGGVVDIAREAHLPITPFTFSLQQKSEGYKNLKRLLEQGQLKLLHNDKLLMQITAMEYGWTSAGDLKIAHPDGGHDDAPDSVMLAAQGIKGPKPDFRIRFGPKR